MDNVEIHIKDVDDSLIKYLQSKGGSICNDDTFIFSAPCKNIGTVYFSYNYLKTVSLKQLALDYNYKNTKRNIMDLLKGNLPKEKIQWLMSINIELSDCIEFDLITRFENGGGCYFTIRYLQETSLTTLMKRYCAQGGCYKSATKYL